MESNNIGIYLIADIKELALFTKSHISRVSMYSGHK